MDKRNWSRYFELKSKAYVLMTDVEIEEFARLSQQYEAECGPDMPKHPNSKIIGKRDHDLAG
jgi:hypothetical protein